MTDLTAREGAKAPHLELLSRLERGHRPFGSFFDGKRQQAKARFEALGFPAPRAEAWRYSPVSALAKVPFEAAPERPLPQSRRAELAGVAEGVALVFVNGRFSVELSRLEPLGEGVFAGSLAEGLRRGDEAVRKHLGGYATFQDHPFTALNTALLEEGALVVLGPGASASGPIHLVYLSMGEGAPLAIQPRTLIVAEEASRATVVESHVGLGGVSLSNAVTEVVVDRSAKVEHLLLIREGEGCFHQGTLQARVGAQAEFSSTVLMLSGGRTRRETSVLLAEPGATTRLEGLYLGGGEQHLDNHTFIDHAVPGCTSEENYRGIVGGKATAVFDGHVLVRPLAQKSSAALTNKNLLLSDDATVDAKPTLEIFADDVKATHGEAVGRLDADSIFYLRSRGLDERAARQLLTLAFARQVLDRIAVPSLAPSLDRLVSGALTRLAEEGS